MKANNTAPISTILAELNEAAKGFQYDGDYTGFHDKIETVIYPVVKKYGLVSRSWGIYPRSSNKSMGDNIIKYACDFKKARRSAAFYPKGIMSNVVFSMSDSTRDTNLTISQLLDLQEIDNVGENIKWWGQQIELNKIAISEFEIQIADAKVRQQEMAKAYAEKVMRGHE